MSAQENSRDSGSKSPEEVQREVRQSRAEVEETLEAIEERLSPGQLFDQAVDYLRSGGGTDFFRPLGIAARDNPLPVVLVGIGLAWLMFSGARSRPRGYDENELLDERAGAGDYPEKYTNEADFGGLCAVTSTARAAVRLRSAPSGAPKRHGARQSGCVPRQARRAGKRIGRG